MNVISHLSTLESAGLVRLAQVMPDLEYLFRHILVQDAVYASLLQPDQQRLHREVGEALEWLYPDRLNELAPTLARHYEKAGDLARALQYFQRAARIALESFANHEAEHHYLSALALKPENSVQAGLFSGLGEACYRQGRFKEAIETWQRAIGIYRQLSDPENIARLYARSARAAWFQGEIPHSLEICKEGLQVVTGAPLGPGLAGLMHETARAYFFNGDFEQARPLCRQALQMAESLGAVDVQADALSTLGLLLEDSPEEAIGVLTRAVDLAEAAGLLDIGFRAHINLGSAVRNFKNDIKGCRKHFLRSAELARRRGALQEEVFALNGVASLMLHTGETEELETLLAELERLQSGLPSRGQSADQLDYMRGTIMLMRGSYGQAMDLFHSLRQEAVKRADTIARANLDESLVSAILDMYETGQPCDLAEAEAIIQEELAAPPAGKHTEFRILFHLLSSRLKLYQGDLAEASRLHEAAQALISDDHKIYRVMLILTKLEIVRARGELGNFWEDFDFIHENRNRVFIYYYGRALWRFAETGLERGEPEDLERAQSLLLEGIELFQRLKNPVLLERLQKLLQSSHDQTIAQAAAQKKVVQELAMAARIQGTFLPEEPPSLPGWQIAIAFQPARQTSGDFYDFIPLPGGRMGIVISDVADKGMGAALYMTSARSLMRAYAAEFPDEPAAVVSRASQRLTSDTHGGLFVTLFYGVLDPQSGELLYVNAGHNPPYLFQAGQPPQALAKTGIPLGVFDDASWKDGRATLPPGSLLVMYTDGVTEAINQAEVQFGEERLIEAANDCPPDSLQSGQNYAAQVRDCILQAIRRHRGASPQSDDITMMVLAR